MAKKIIFFLVVTLFLFFLFSDSVLAACNGGPDCPKGQLCKEGKCVGRALEVVYPNIPGVVAPKSTATGLPEYVDYIFKLAIVIIGFVIFGALDYAGVNYLLSFGNPAKLSDAKEGIFAAFLGGVILLSAWLIFNIINPQLTILTLPEVEVLPYVIPEGVYVCTYNAGDIEPLLNKYINSIGNEQIEAAKELGKIMTKSETEKCLRANFSGNFENFVLEKEDTIFIVPTVMTVPDETDATKTKRKPVYKYGIILHENDDFRGKCQYYPQEDSNNLFFTVVRVENGELKVGDDTHQIDGYKPGDRMPFDKARSFTVFKKPVQEPSGDARGIILFTCLDYNRTGMCPEGVDSNSDGDPFGTGGADIKLWKGGGLGDLQGNTRSVKVDPKDGYFGIVYNEMDGEGECAIIKSNDPNLLDLRFPDNGFCDLGNRLFGWLPWVESYDKCAPGIKSMRVIKGMAL